MEQIDSKEYNDISLDQFKKIISDLKEFKNEDKSLQELVSSAPKEKILKLVGNDFCWSEVYELTFLQHLGLILLAMDKLEFMKEVNKTADPTQYFMDNFEFDEDPDLYAGGHNGLFSKGDFIGLIIALQRSILSILIHQKTLQTLVEEVKNGNDNALFDAVRIDRSIITCPTISKRLALAEFQNEHHFFLRLRSAIKGPSRRHWEGYRDLRYALFVLRELGFDRLNDTQLEDLLVKQLKVYPDNYNARKNLRKQYNESKKIKNLK